MDDLHDTKNHLERQAIAAFRRGNDLDSLISRLDDGTLSRCTDLNTGHYGNQPLGRAFLVKELLELNWVELQEWIAKNDRTTKLGFKPDKFADGADAPARTTLSRAWNNRFGEVQDYIQWQAERVRERAAEQGHPLGSPLQAGESDSKGTSERTKQRVLRGKAQDVLDELEKLVFPSLSLNRPNIQSTVRTTCSLWKPYSG